MPSPIDDLDFTDKYNTPIPPARQAAFDQYVQQEIAKPKGKDPRIDRYDYDVNGDWLAGAKRDERGHGDDQFKKPNHSTFSDQSQYHGLDGYVGGRWTTDGYEPSQTNLQFHPQPELADYFAGTEKGMPLLPAAQVPKPTGRGGQYRIGDFGQVTMFHPSGDFERDPTAQSRFTRTPVAIGMTPETPDQDTGRTFYEKPDRNHPIYGKPGEATRIEVNPGPSASRNSRAMRHESIHALLGPYANRLAADPDVRKAAAPITARFKQNRFDSDGLQTNKDIETELPAYMGAFSSDVGEMSSGVTPEERNAYTGAYAKALDRRDPKAAAMYRRMLKDSSAGTPAGENQIGLRTEPPPVSGPGKSGRYGQPRRYAMEPNP